MRTIALTTVLALTACSSNYIPQSRGRVSVIMQTGGQAYVRDGKIIEHGIFGGGLEDAVRGNPKAIEAANEYQDRVKFGLLGIFGGLACSAGGLAYAIAKASPDDDSPSRASERGLWISLGCLVVMMAGGVYLASAEPYRWDAINIFNDAPPPPMQLPGTPGYGYRAQNPSLKMRD